MTTRGKYRFQFRLARLTFSAKSYEDGEAQALSLIYQRHVSARVVFLTEGQFKSIYSESAFVRSSAFLSLYMRNVPQIVGQS